jgi:hypothetical protein
MELELASEATSDPGVTSVLFANFELGVAWSTVCPAMGLAKPRVVEAASIAATKGVKRMSLRSFGTSTHHVD